MKTIPLSKGKVAIVDNEHFEAINQFKWSAHSRGYAYRQAKGKDGKRRSILLHRFVMELAGREPGHRTDHINGERLDCRADNLRAATASQNGANSKRRINNTSGFKGVSWHGCGKWQAYIRVHGESRRHLGLFDCKVQAACAYDAAARKAWGQFAALNFPETDYTFAA